MTRFSNCFFRGKGCGEARLPQPQPFFFALMGQRLPAEAQGETSAELLVLLPRPRLVASLQGQIEQGSFFSPAPSCLWLARLHISVTTPGLSRRKQNTSAALGTSLRRGRHRAEPVLGLGAEDRSCQPLQPLSQEVLQVGQARL